MKPMLAITLSIVLLFLLPACGEAESHENQVAFFYQTQDIRYDPQRSTLEAEYRDSADFASLEQALDAYFTGPVSTSLANPFPAGLSLISAREENGTLTLILTDALSELTGTQLSIACCCIAKTCLEMTGAEEVSISAETQLLDGARSIVLTHESMHLLDSTQ